MADTNILFSALLFPSSLPAKALCYIVDNHDLILCDYIVSEIKEVVSRKRPDLLADLDVLLAGLSYELVVAPTEPRKLISDPKDQPILNSAILANIDIIISGDKHFLHLKLDMPKTMTAAQFWQLEQMD